MIFVTIGTSEPFDRLLAAIDSLDTTEEIVAQVGSSTHRLSRARCYDFLTFEQTLEYMRAARVVVSHAGVGSVLAALTVGRVPVVMPRLRRHGEAVDDHQLPFARRLASEGLVLLAEEPVELGAALELVQDHGLDGIGATDLASDLRAYIASVLPDRTRVDGHDS
jgi:UDP-N-acetylglucosamine transferase subunit ALG13